MNVTRRRRLLAILLAGAWLPITVSCRPGGFDGVIRVITDGWGAEEVIVEEVYEGHYYYDDYCGYYDGWGSGTYFDFYYDD